MNEKQLILLEKLNIGLFKERFPWIGGDLQTLRDTFINENLPKENGQKIKIPIPEMPLGNGGSGHLIAILDKPNKLNKVRGLVLILHGLGGSSRRQGLRRMSLGLIDSGFAVLRLNLRGADPGRKYAAGTYSAKCNSDLIPVIISARKICNDLANEYKSIYSSIPLFGVGISLGGTILLNSCFDEKYVSSSSNPILDGLVCISSPLDLAVCSSSIERPRNFIYQSWLLQRLIKQTIADPFGIKEEEKNNLIGSNPKKSNNISSIRDFDSVITAPRWGFKDVDDYYNRASPLNEIPRKLIHLPKSLFIQSKDDPWVPADSIISLSKKINFHQLDNNLNIILTSSGGHNGFHGINGCWGDHLIRNWLIKLTN